MRMWTELPKDCIYYTNCYTMKGLKKKENKKKTKKKTLREAEKIFGK